MNMIRDCRPVVQTLALLFFLGFAVRLVVAHLLLGGLGRTFEGDESAYAGMALRLVEGMGFVDNRGNSTSILGPAVPLLVAIPTAFFGPQIAGIRVFMCLIEALLVPACYLFARSVAGSRKVGLTAATIAVFFPTWIVPSGAVMTDMPAAVLIALLVWLLVEGFRRESLSWIAGAGFVWGVAILTRAVSLSYAPAIILWLLFVMPNLKMRFAAIGTIMISAALVVGPWSIRNTYVHGTFVLTSTQGGSEFNKGNNPMATGILAYDHAYFSENLQQRYPREQYVNEARRSGLYQADAVNFISENPGRFIELCFIRFIELWKLYSARVPLTASLAVIGSFGVALPFFLIQVVRRGWHRGPEMLLLLIIACHTAVHVVYTSIVRYRVPIEPFVIIMAIQGFCWSYGRIQYGITKAENRNLKIRSASQS
jgi:4-amino-4-deoxy-L-arabinose transferase-like glycosyltransferase